MAILAINVRTLQLYLLAVILIGENFIKGEQYSVSLINHSDN